MRMKIAWLPALIFCATLALVAAGLDLGPIIKTAQCRSMCLRYHMIDDNCWKKNKTDNQINDCDECWDTCEVLGLLEKDKRYNMCVQRNYQNENHITLTILRFVPLNSTTPDIPYLYECEGCKTACTFYETRGTEEDKYEPTKLPAPEESEPIHLNNYDVAVLMQKNSQGIWEEENYYYAKEQPTIIPDGWIIVVTDDGVVKHYSWEKWQPKLQLLNASGPLYQAYITWQDWRIQLKKQRENITSNYFKTIFERRAMKKKEYEPSFVVTWQQQAGDGIMGNQVTDSESAQISLSCGKYLVRVATNDGPGSYPIVVDTGICKIPEVLSWNLINEYVTDIKISLFVLILLMMGLLCSIIIYLYLFGKYRIKNGKETRMEEGCLTEAKKKLMKKGNLTKIQKKLMNQDVLGLYSNCNHSMVNLVQTMEMDMNVNASVKAQDANASTQDANASTQNANTSTQNTNANVIQKT